MSLLANSWYKLLDAIQSATAVLVIAGGLAGILLITLFSIFKIRKINASFAIIFSTVLSCFLIVPVISSFNNLINLKIKGILIDEGKAEIKIQKAEIEKLKAENKIRDLERIKLENQITISKQTIEMEALNDNIKLLENAQLSMQSFQKILELALLQTNLKQTMVRKEALNRPEAGLGIRADYYYDEVLVILTHDIIAKFGINLNEVKLSKVDGNTVVISGIQPTFIGTSRNITDALVKEIRRINYKKNVINSVIVQNDRASALLADRYSSAYETEFQTKLSAGAELAFMDDAVIQLAENFLRVMLAPLFKNIRFDDSYKTSAIPLMEYLQNELSDYNNKRREIISITEELSLTNNQLLIELSKSEIIDNNE
jgi:hypothetical protein